MDRNDYYGGESTSLNLVQVGIWNVLSMRNASCIDLLEVSNYISACSFGRSSKEAIILHHIWVLAGTTMLTWCQRFSSLFLSVLLMTILCFMVFLLTTCLCGQFIMANGELVRVLIHTDVTKYLYFKAVDGSFVFNKGKVKWVLLNFNDCSCGFRFYDETHLCCNICHAIGSQGASKWHGGLEISSYGNFWEASRSQVLHICTRL